MAIIKNLDYEEGEVKNNKKTKKTKIPKVKKAGSKGSSFWTMIIIVVVILIIIGIAFAYTNGKLSKLQDGEKSEALKAQIESLQQEIENLSQKAQALQEENEQNKEVVIDLFDKNRELPKTVETSNWLIYNNEQLDFQIYLPEYWEVAKTIVTSPEQESAPAAKPAADASVEQPSSQPTEEDIAKEENKQETEEKTVAKNQQAIYLQPKNEPIYALAMTIKNEYLELSDLPLAEKYDLFKDLKVIDQKNFDQGKMMYFIDIDDNNNEIPTVLIITKTGIFKATFNVTDKSLDNYFKYRLDFEKIVKTFQIVEKTLAQPAVDSQPTQE